MLEIDRLRAEWNKTKDAAIFAYAEVLELNAPMRFVPKDSTPADKKWEAACMAHLKAGIAVDKEIARDSDAS